LPYRGLPLTAESRGLAFAHAATIATKGIQTMIHISGSYRMLRMLTIVLMLAWLALSGVFSSRSAYAHGGAPTLAYVAGTTKGSSIIDIAQQKVNGTFTLRGCLIA